jgi:hypothetical protein
MRKALVVFLTMLPVIWLGCGGDDNPTEPTPPSIITVTAATGTVAPARLSVEDSVWNRITARSIAVAANRYSASGKEHPTASLSVADSVRIQAVVVHDTLYLRLSWADATLDCWPGRFAVTNILIIPTPPDTLAVFTQDALSFSEDQAMVFLQAAGDETWDVWNWRLATTGVGLLAEDFSLSGTTLTQDAGTVSVATSNLGQAGQPSSMEPGGPDNEDYRLYASEAVPLDAGLNWAIDDYVSGWVIDDSLYLPQNAATRGSRYDVGAVSSYAGSPSRHTVVLHRALNSDDAADLDMSELTTVRMRIGITDNSDFSMTQGSTRQGFTGVFQLTLP